VSADRQADSQEDIQTVKTVPCFLFPVPYSLFPALTDNLFSKPIYHFLCIINITYIKSIILLIFIT
jgi:hypothetical protein